MITHLKFIAWKMAELLTFIISFPFLFIGTWVLEASDWCHDKAIPYEPRRLGR